MQILEIENQKTILQQKLEETLSNRRKLLFIYDFFDLILSSSNKVLIESYLSEYIEVYSDLLNNFDITGINPTKTKEITELTRQLIDLDYLQSYSKKLNEIIIRLETNVNNIESVLDGSPNYKSLMRKAFFPLLEENEIKDELSLGLLESISITIKKSKYQTKFVIVPSSQEIEKRIAQQTQDSWETAIEFVKKYKRKINPYHEIIISFDKRIGNYVGNSLGIALTISFLEELLSFYNSQTIVNINEGVAFTGSNDKKGNISEVSKEIIEKKVEVVFYSFVKTFVVPDKDKESAVDKLKELQKDFPKRNLEIISVANLNDLLNRRNLVEIKKQKTAKRIYKFSRKNWVSLTLLFVLAIVVAISGLIDFDNNPALLVNEGVMLHVENKNGKILWSKKLIGDYSSDEMKPFISVTQKIVDINDDGINEVVITDEQLVGTKDELDLNRVACFSNKGELIWRYNFRDSILTKEGIPERRYGSHIIDTLTENGTKVLYLFARHNIIYCSAVYKLNLETGKRLDGTLWSQGHIDGGIIDDFNKDGKNELIMTCCNNGYDRQVILSIDLDEINGQTPSTYRYLYLNKKIANFNKFILLPKSDYNDYFNERRNLILLDNIKYEADIQKIIFAIFEGRSHDWNTLDYYRIDFDPSLNNCNIIISDGFQMKRDALVKNGFLNLPYTNTEAFVNILKSQIRYWDGEKLVKPEGLIKN